MIGFIFFSVLSFLSTSANVVCPPWESLTTPELLSAVDPWCFFSANSSDLDKIPGPSCAGFTTNQSSQLAKSNNHSDACKGLSFGCCSSMSLEGAAGIGTSCIEFMTAELISEFNATQVHAIPAESFSGFTKTNLAGLGASCAGLTAAQTAQLAFSTRLHTCAGLSAACGSALSVDGAGGFTDSCLMYAPATFFEGISPDALHNVPADAFNGFDMNNLAGLGAACAAMTMEQAAFLAASSTRYDACDGMRPSCGKSISTLGVSGLTDRCFKHVRADFIGSLNATQVAAIAPFSFGGIGKGNAAGFGSNCAGLSDQQVKNLGSTSASNIACSGLTSICSSAIPTAAMPGFTAMCIFCVTEDFVSGLSAPQVSAITPIAFVSFSETSIHGMTSSCSGILKDQASFLGAGILTYDVCSGIQASCFGNATVAMFGGLNMSCTHSVAPPQLALVSSEKINAMNADGLKGFSSACWLAIVVAHGNTVVETLTVDQLHLCMQYKTSAFNIYVDNETVKPSRTICPSPADPSKLTWLMLSMSGHDDAACISDTDAANLVVEAFMGLRARQVPRTKPSAFGSAKTGVLYFLSVESIWALNADQVAAFSPKNFSMIGSGVNNLNPPAVSRLSKEAVEELSSAWDGRWTCNISQHLQRVPQNSLVCAAKKHGDEYYYVQTCHLPPCDSQVSSSLSEPEPPESHSKPPHHTSSSSSSEHKKKKGSIVGIIVGVSCGAIAAVGLVGAGVFYFYRLRRPRTAYSRL